MLPSSKMKNTRYMSPSHSILNSKIPSLIGLTNLELSRFWVFNISNT